MSIEAHIASLEKALFDVETYLADPDGHPIHAINMALEVIGKARQPSAYETVRALVDVAVAAEDLMQLARPSYGSRLRAALDRLRAVGEET